MGALCMGTVAVALGIACARSPRAVGPAHAVPVTSRGEVAPTPTPAPALAGREWTLVQLDGRDAPLGAGGRAATLRLDGAQMRASGFAGCNTYSGPYTVKGDSLGFGPAVATKMACTDAADLEQRYLAMLPTVVGYLVADSTLTLRGPSGELARFRAR
jgi:heat shock protein HslJ